ncbi:MAG: EAL domain-containing protein, partial [Gammaproteobacteria bacterium]|nr:EAL domain-containing protein [Gammaproteobacteria bacterium]
LSDQLQFQARHDSLTSLINRREFERRLENALEDSKADHTNHLLCYLDLDQFKVVNDTCGHSAGDELLKQLAPLLKPLIRDHDVLARLGGDEFGVLLENCSLEKGLEVTNRLLEAIKSYRFIWKKNAFDVGVSIGVVEINQHSTNFNELMIAADSACYVAKDLGRNQIHIYRDDDQALVKRQGEMQWIQRLNKSLSNDDFELYYQPIVPTDPNNTSNRPLIYELLIRMKSDDGTIIPPMAFIPTAERYNLAPQLDRWVVNAASKYLKQYTDHPIMGNSLFTINLSGQSLSDHSFLDFVIDCISEDYECAHKICFEITETAAIANLTSATIFINTLRGMGCKFALDDFGSGLSSYSYLKSLNVDYIKIDGSFISNIQQDKLNQAFVTSINQIADIMGIETIAEFVDSQQTADFLHQIKVAYMQGYWIAEPESLTHLFTEDTDKQFA